ncbi:MAG: S26 family signal peptidase [Synergistaceae bacterium]|nr:S26 family signal peptidase [Synergistaceae bacterium]
MRKFALFLVIFWIVIALALSTGKFTINVTISEPLGLWFKTGKTGKTGGEIVAGDIVLVEFKYFSSINWVPDVYPARNFAGNPMPFLKRVAGLPGDLIERDDSDSGGLIRVNGVVMPDTALLSRDSLGNELNAFILPHRLESGEVWLLSESPVGFDSRYLGPAKLDRCEKIIPLITF